MRWVVWIVGVFWILGNAYASADLSKYAHDFWLPRYQKQRLSYCLLDQKTCGQPVADAYCQKLGYAAAQHATIDYNVGYTRFLDKMRFCKGWACHGFKLIRCYAKADHKPAHDYHYRYKKFVLPRVRHYRLAWCYRDDHQCGKYAANAFCRYLGYETATSYKLVEHLAATRSLGDQQLCFENCQGFASITCYR